MPSEFDTLKWEVTLADLRLKIELKAGLENLHSLQVYQGVAEVARAVFGDGKSSSKSQPPVFDEKAVPKDFAEAQQKFKAVFG